MPTRTLVVVEFQKSTPTTHTSPTVCTSVRVFDAEALAAMLAESGL